MQSEISKLKELTSAQLKLFTMFRERNPKRIKNQLVCGRTRMINAKTTKYDNYKRT